MTRKLLLILVLLCVMFFSINIIYGKSDICICNIEKSSNELNNLVDLLSQKSTMQFDSKMDTLKQSTEKYKTLKQEYEEIVSKYSESEIKAIENEIQKDVYDIDFLWIILGNLATKSNIKLEFDLVENDNSNNYYSLCDLKFKIKGQYLNILQFLQDLSNDKRLKFEIKDFYYENGSKEGTTTFKIEEIKIQKENKNEE